ncbi:hypothetical protein LLE49_22270 [Alicyclobacillus tolerans]|uniref:hypothetical protein n=1 Tax=Alicyclobacillus tolerans TaxID=90970 RepID=UPI001F2A9753|nr:hypothetical protein [Alicyclobacillus tolerans]MCF8567448.1 hypothetical protein [Alicyclobacillus tolerans]
MIRSSGRVAVKEHSLQDVVEREAKKLEKEAQKLGKLLYDCESDTQQAAERVLRANKPFATHLRNSHQVDADVGESRRPTSCSRSSITTAPWLIRGYFGVDTIGGIPMSIAHSAAVIGWVLVAGLTVFGYKFLVIPGEKYNETEYVRQKEQWERAWVCGKCGSVFESCV